MSFPYDDPAWCEVADLLLAAVEPGETVLAPDLFWWRLDDVHRMVRANLAERRRYDWVVVHKGEMAAVGREFLTAVASTMVPRYANAVFVVWGPRADRRVGPGAFDLSSPHLASFFEVLARLGDDPEPLPAESDRVLGAQPRLRRFSSMSDAEVRAAQDDFFRLGGYTYPTARDRAYYAELRRVEEEALARWAGRRVLELACGATPASAVDAATLVVRTDLSAVGVATARAADRGRSSLTHAAADARRLPFPDGAFDAVAFVDAIEHVRGPAAVFAESARVLSDVGELLVTFANADSLNQVVTRALGNPGFETNHQHMQELSFAEVRALLDRHGFAVVETGGIELRPYWGVPGIDDATRAVLDEDDRFAALMIELGHRVGVEHAYVGVVRARKRRRGVA